MAEAKKVTKPTAAQKQVTALEARVAVLEGYIKTFDAFLSNSMISNVVDSAANEALAEMAADIN